MLVRTSVLLHWLQLKGFLGKFLRLCAHVYAIVSITAWVCALFSLMTASQIGIPGPSQVECIKSNGRQGGIRE
jgi:hypothetical protein